MNVIKALQTAEKTILNYASTEDEVAKAIEDVDALGDPGASQAIRHTMQWRNPRNLGKPNIPHDKLKAFAKPTT